MSPSPHQPIPESTQVHVDRLLGSNVGEHRVLTRVGEGRWGTLYRAQHHTSGAPATIQVLRTELDGHDEEARAANAIGCRGIATVSAFGELADGRRYRVLEPLAGESLEQRLATRGPLAPQDVARALDQVATVLEAAHAWAIVHGSLGPSSVFQVGDAVRVIDFGLARQRRSPQDDLNALGRLGFTLLTGEDLRDGPLPRPSARIPESLDRLLRELVDQRVKNATEARKQLAGLSWGMDARAPASRRWAVLASLAVVALGGVVAVLAWPPAHEPELPTAVEPASSLPGPVEEDPLSLLPEDVLDPVVEQGVEPPGPHPTGPRPQRPVPSAQALAEQASRLETLLRRQARPGDDVEQALFVLNKQRLRLTGSPSLEDRKEVARQLAGWRRSYLRK